MSLEYARLGLIGVLTPQANTTVEPEFGILWPAGVAMINGRLMSTKVGMEDRLIDYFEQLDQSLAQFANAPVGAVALACTGASYLAGASGEQEMIDRLSKKIGAPFITAGRAVQLALQALGAKQIALVSPYPPALTSASIVYWNALGFEVTSVVHVGSIDKSFHPIYSISAGGTLDGLDSLEDKPFDAVVMLGTGMPTLQPILDRPQVRGAPVMSCMLCLGWAAAQTVMGGEMSAESLRAWIAGTHWRARLEAHQGLASAAS
ncbi:MAG: Asp/Glu racemase [Hyphomicrobiales bacterium]|jgi:maleate isomerase|nr:Asp/Glu racemase [Hyphomicrobiales bacterium]